jgi:putative ABC transport system ATP-binding protein
MLSPVSGNVLVDGRSVYKLRSEERSLLRRKSIGFVFQTFNLVPYLTAFENVQIPLLLAGMGESAQKERAIALLGEVGLSDRLDHKPSELSIGQQQRVALARMLANDPCIILADEPTGNLDPDTGREILSFLESAHREGRTVVMVTHDQQMARGADRVIRLADGRLC